MNYVVTKCIGLNVLTLAMTIILPNEGIEYIDS
uniref:Uncharacterized protein n=1 Tax=Anguilla anguilla TaxID=7936 RepID=A0A0E9XIW3_ANGAN